MLTTLSLSLPTCSIIITKSILSVFPTHIALHPGQKNSCTTNDSFNVGALPLLLQMKSISF